MSALNALQKQFTHRLKLSQKDALKRFWHVKQVMFGVQHNNSFTFYDVWSTTYLHLPTQLSGNRRRVVYKDCPPVPVARTPTSYEPSESSPGRLTLDAVVLAVVSCQLELPSFLHSTSNVW